MSGSAACCLVGGVVGVETGGTFDLVGVDGEATGCRARIREAKARGVIGSFEEATPIADDDRRDNQAKLIDKARIKQ